MAQQRRINTQKEEVGFLPLKLTHLLNSRIPFGWMTGWGHFYLKKKSKPFDIFLVIV